jgi:hypothetical protein
MNLEKIRRRKYLLSQHFNSECPAKMENNNLENHEKEILASP